MDSTPCLSRESWTPWTLGSFPLDFTIDEIPSALGYGIWGDHGMAGLALADGPFSGRAANVPVSGTVKVALPFAFGDVSGTNPGGTGHATWTGVC